MLLSELFNDDPFYTTVEEREVISQVMSLCAPRLSQIVRESKTPIFKRRIHIRKKK